MERRRSRSQRGRYDVSQVPPSLSGIEQSTSTVPPALELTTRRVQHRTRPRTRCPPNPPAERKGGGRVGGPESSASSGFGHWIWLTVALAALSTAFGSGAKSSDGPKRCPPLSA